MLSYLWRWLRDRLGLSFRRSRASHGRPRQLPRRPTLEALEERAVPAIINPPNIVTGPDSGLRPQMRIFNAVNGTQEFNFLSFRQDFTNGVRVALGDVTGDGIPDIITGAGMNSGPRVRIYDGDNQVEIVNFRALAKKARNGVFVAAGNFDSDTALEVVVGAGNKQRVRIFDIANGAATQIPGPLGDLLITRKGQPFTSTRVATGNVDGQAGDELIVALGEGVAPQVLIYNSNGAQLTSFLAYNQDFLGGVYLAVGDVDGNGREEIITGPGQGAESSIRIFNNLGTQLQTFRAFEEGFLGGARVGTVDADGDGRADIIVGRGPGGLPEVSTFDGQSLAQLDTFFAYSQSFLGGVYVAGT